MRLTCIISFIVFASMILLSVLSLFDIVDYSAKLHGIFGVIAVVALCVWVKTTIKLYKSTRKF